MTDPIRTKIGCTRTIQTAVLVTAYLEKRHNMDAGKVRYVPTEATEANGWWVTDIIVDVYSSEDAKAVDEMVAECRAFTAGRGEVWC